MIVGEGNPGGRSETVVEGFVKVVGSKPRVKERERKRGELWMSRVVNQKRKL